jgi:hypothetical protein
MARRKTRDLTPEEIVTEMHPYNEWSGAHTRAAVAEIGELVRYLNHATQHPEALPDPAAIGEVLRLLGQSVRRLPQVVKQAEARLAGFTGEAVEGAAELGERLDALGSAIQKAGFAAKRHVPPGSDAVADW